MTLKTFTSLITKNLKIFFRSKYSAITILILPLIIVLCAGFLFNSTNLSDVTISVYSDNYTPLTKEILDDFSVQGYLIKNSSSLKDCIDSVKLTKSQICIDFPADLSKEGSTKNVTFFIDYSRINLAYTLIYEIEGKISLEGTQAGTFLVQDLIDSVIILKEKIPQNKEKIDTSKTSISTNNQALQEISLSTSEINSIINSLKDAKEVANSSIAINKIEESITALEQLKQKTEESISEIDKVSSSNEEIILELEKISSNLNNVITELNKQKSREAKSMVSPITVSIESISLNSKNRDYLIPTILTLIALFGSILLSSSLVLREKKTKAYFRNFITPTKDLTFILATYLTCLIILSIQFLIVILGIKFILMMNVSILPLELITILLLSLSTFIAMGLFVGFIFKSEETTIFASVLISSILLFFSNVIIPIENIAGNFRGFAEFNPVVLLDVALKKIILFNFSFDSIFTEIIAFAIYFVFFIIITYFARRITKRRM